MVDTVAVSAQYYTLIFNFFVCLRVTSVLNKFIHMLFVWVVFIYVVKVHDCGVGGSAMGTG